MDGVTIKIIENPDEELCEAVNLQLRTHNQTFNSIFWENLVKKENQPKPLNIFAFAKNNNAIGGLFGTTQFSWLKIDTMGIKKEFRKGNRQNTISASRGLR